MSGKLESIKLHARYQNHIMTMQILKAKAAPSETAICKTVRKMNKDRQINPHAHDELPTAEEESAEADKMAEVEYEEFLDEQDELGS